MKTNSKMKNFLKKIYPIFGILLFYNLNPGEKLFANGKSFEWYPVGVDQYGNITEWINISSFKTLNKDSFRLQMKLLEENKVILGRLDLNCRNKDYYLRKRGKMSQKGNWNSITKGSSFEEIAKFYCKKTSAASNWGYTAETKYLWGIEKPNLDASSFNLQGEWINVYKNSSSEFQYNSNVIKSSDSVLAAYYFKKKLYKKNSPYISSKYKFGWIVVSCKEKLHSTFKKFDNTNIAEWTAPKKGRIGGGADAIRKAECY
ncbi:hypothetical protein [uncultured Prochlorococcus sp.]|uniref:hypothetical protein n=1 Tax=uncultured Prochlorococcus sp. TaxID=159733 RepID=UPI00258E5755|nr:hypothetical protein [uncultured Prochlorococcus sp.]